MEICLILDNQRLDNIDNDDVSLIIAHEGTTIESSKCAIIGYDNYNFPAGVFIEKYKDKDLQKTVKSLRNKHGDDYIIGVHSHNSYDSAMVAGEAGADFIAFEYNGQESRELIDLWDKFTIIPYVVFGDIQELLKEQFSAIAINSSNFNKLLQLRSLL